jgi:hypothetical protein
MKAFFVGLLFLISVCIIFAVGTVGFILLLPLLIVMGLLLRFVFMALLIGLVVWLLGKFILYIFENLFAGKTKHKKS